MILAFITQIAVATTAQPVMTPVVVPSPAIRPVMMAPRSYVRFTVDVRVEGDGIVLWEGPLRLAENNATMVRREQNEPPEIQCDRPPYGINSANGFTLNLNPNSSVRALVEDGGAVSVTLRWTRPSPPVCGARQGSRTVEVTETVLLPPGRNVVIQGDGGLRMTIRRR